MGLIHCSCQTDGTSPDDRDLLKRWVRKGERSDASSFSSLPAISSGPLAFEGLMLDSNFWTLVFFTWSRGMLGYLGPSILQSLLRQLVSAWRQRETVFAEWWPLTEHLSEVFRCVLVLLSHCCLVAVILYTSRMALNSSLALLSLTCLQWAEQRAFLVTCASSW